MAGDVDRCYAAVLGDWDATLARAPRASLRRARLLIERLCELGIEIVMRTKGDPSDIDAQLCAHPPDPGRLHLCGEQAVLRINTTGAGQITTTADSRQWARDYFCDRGIGRGLVLVIDAGGHERLLTRLTDLADRLRWAVPDIDEDPEWTLHLPERPGRDAADAALTTLADGRFGTRGVGEDDGGAAPVLIAGGVYAGQGSSQHLLAGPSWVAVRRPAGFAAAAGERVLDLRSGVLVRRRLDDRGYRSMRLVAADGSGLMALRVQSHDTLGGTPLVGPQVDAGVTTQSGRDGPATWMRVVTDTGGLTAAAAQWHRRRATWRSLERRVVVVADADAAPGAGVAVDRLHDHLARSFPALLAEQRSRWAARWAAADVLIPDDPQLQLAIRLAMFHLQSSAAGCGEAAVGARGLTGPGYHGHVFWDSDVFVLPALTAISPAAARAMLVYRLRRLDAARAFAAASGRRGARFPWESARDGTDVTPRNLLVGERELPVRTGDTEEHIVADVAWAASHYAAWTGDRAFLSGDGLPLLVETARYWASRIRTDAAGRGHIDGVIGPDEYHEFVDDNAYTNVLARWNLRRGAEIGRVRPGAVTEDEARDWEVLADTLVDGYDPMTGIVEQFTGYNRLEPPPPGALVRVPIAADLLLGPERLAATQIIKQPDVLMAYHLVPDEMPAGTLAANLAFYGPRTAHGSSLSPAIHAALLARAGDPDAALPWLRLAAHLDLDDVTGATGTGLHLATMGGVWHALVLGFLGLRVTDGAVQVDPRLPSQWSALTVRLQVLGARVEITARPGEVTVTSDVPVPFAVPGESPQPTTSRRWST